MQSYGSEWWRMTEHDLAKLSSFHTTSLGKIQRIFWPRTLSNHDLLARCQREDMETTMARKRWRWIGHVLRKDANSITKLKSTGTQRDRTEAWSTEDNLAKNCGSGNEEHEPQLGH